MGSTRFLLGLLIFLVSTAWSENLAPLTYVSPLPTGQYAVSRRCFGPQGYSLFGRSNHHGIDLNRTRYGTRVQSIAEGRVIHAGFNRGYGYFVVVQHRNGLLSGYSHLSTITVRKGDELSRGQQVGNVGSTGYSTGPHLYLELRRGFAHDYQSFLRQPAIDPMTPTLPLAHQMVANSKDRVDHCATGISAHLRSNPQQPRVSGVR